MLLGSTDEKPNVEDATADIVWQAFCSHSHYTVVVRLYLFQQYRLQLCDSRQPDPYAPPMHGSIVQEMCTYVERKAEAISDLLCMVKDPLALARAFAEPWNCDGPGQRIRLDSRPDRRFHKPVDQYERAKRFDPLLKGVPPACLYRDAL